MNRSTTYPSAEDKRRGGGRPIALPIGGGEERERERERERGREGEEEKQERGSSHLPRPGSRELSRR
jgi:hypothetical protein